MSNTCRSAGLRRPALAPRYLPTAVRTHPRETSLISGYHLFPRRNDLFYEGLGSFLQSSVQQISLQTTAGFGVGTFIKNTNQVMFSVLGGLGWQNTNYSQSTQVTPNVEAALIVADLNLFRFKKTKLEANAVLLPAVSEPGRLHFTTNESYYLKVFGNLSWNLSF